MGVIGVLLIIVGVGVLFSGAIVISLLLFAFGGICLAMSDNSKHKEAELSKNEWVLKCTERYINEGMSPADAKVKAEVDFLVSKNNIYYCKNCIKFIAKEGNDMYSCSYCGHSLINTHVTELEFKALSEEERNVKKEEIIANNAKHL